MNGGGADAHGGLGGSWEAALDLLEARLAQQETQLAAGSVDGSFEPVDLPFGRPGPAERMRAELARLRIIELEREIRRQLDRRPAPARSSPYS
ncbi:MAG: hypothetical protein ACKV2O_08260 [Acidimicrobiales bacterium]